MAAMWGVGSGDQQEATVHALPLPLLLQLEPHARGFLEAGEVRRILLPSCRW